MNIEIHYRLRGEDAPRLLALTHDEYFDELEPGNGYDYDDPWVPKFDHAIEYLDHPAEAVEWARLEVTDHEGRTVTTSRFSTDGVSSFWHRKDPAGGQEMCLDLLVAPERRLIARLRMDDGGDWIPAYTGVFVDQPGDEREVEERIPFGDR